MQISPVNPEGYEISLSMNMSRNVVGTTTKNLRLYIASMVRVKIINTTRVEYVETLRSFWTSFNTVNRTVLLRKPHCCCDCYLFAPLLCFKGREENFLDIIRLWQS